MQVTFDPVSIGFRHVKLFIKQPVVQASINSDPLTSPVPVNGAKSDRLLARMFHDCLGFGVMRSNRTGKRLRHAGLTIF